MTIKQIEEEAKARFPREPKECRLSRATRLAAIEAFKKKLLIKYGFEKVNS
jgi:hypothetical protein